MEIFESIEEFLAWRKKIKGSIGFVPTMGALHGGHLSLVEKAKEENDEVIVSIFVNPTQFLAGEDLSKYPRKIEADLALCKRAGVSAVFLPTARMMYEGYQVKVCVPEPLGYILEGHFRPGHFDGVAQVVLKLFTIVSPKRAYFGKKDAQQLAVIHALVKSFFLPITIVECETLREKDGLAMSSRNVYLTVQEREKALALSCALKKALTLIALGELDVSLIKEAIYIELCDVVIDYVAIVSRDFISLEQIERGNTLILLACRVGTTRLIDNARI